MRNFIWNCLDNFSSVMNIDKVEQKILSAYALTNNAKMPAKFREAMDKGTVVFTAQFKDKLNNKHNISLRDVAIYNSIVKTKSGKTRNCILAKEIYIDEHLIQDSKENIFIPQHLREVI